jgi:hypothetical protein
MKREYKLIASITGAVIVCAGFDVLASQRVVYEFIQ